MARFLRQHAARWRILLVFGEAVCIIGALYLAVYLRYFGSIDPLESYESGLTTISRAVLLMLALMLGMTALGLHQTHLRESWFGVLARQLVGFFVGWLGLVFIYYLYPPSQIGRGVLGFALLLSFVTIAFWRWLVMRLVDVEALKRRVLVLGAGWRAATIVERMRRRSDRQGFVIVGFVSQGSEEIKVPTAQVLQLNTELSSWVDQQRIDEVVVGVDDRRGGLPMDELLRCRQFGVDVTDLSTFFERESGRVQLALTEPSWLIFSGGFDGSSWRQLSKRGFDLLVAAVMLTLTWPLMLLTALAIVIESGPRKPMLYRQERVGEGGKVFKLFKFRSMRTDAEHDGVARWAQKGDDRVTHVGKFIRKARLDELPQIWNVLRGDMSFIGPRPERPQFVAELAQKVRYYNLRHAVKPGLAGWAQLRYPYGASVEDAAEKLKYDLFYVKNHNLLLDVLIMIQTVEVVLFGRGAR